MKLLVDTFTITTVQEYAKKIKKELTLSGVGTLHSIKNPIHSSIHYFSRSGVYQINSTPCAGVECGVDCPGVDPSLVDRQGSDFKGSQLNPFFDNPTAAHEFFGHKDY